MKITIEKPLSISEKGKRENNEDAFFPQPGQAGTESDLFIVCDGVGGAERGEVASNIACNAIAEYFQQNQIVSSDYDTISKAIAHAEEKIDRYLEENPSAHGMGTTLSLLHLHKNGATVAWCGDSRVYHIRDNRILFQTVDHSFVNDMLKAGIIKPEDAENHPKKNVITRAIQGSTVKKARADVKTISGIRSGDLFFLCTDGILESIDDTALLGILGNNASLSAKIDEIGRVCKENSNDNYTCYLVKIKKLTGKSKPGAFIPTASQVNKTSAEPETTKPLLKAKKEGIRKPTKRKSLIYLFIIAFAVISSLSLLFLPRLKIKNEDSTSVEAEIARQENAIKPVSEKEKLIEDEHIMQSDEKPAREVVAPSTATDTERSVFTDPRDNNSYTTVVINDTEWFAVNLNYEVEGADIMSDTGNFRYYNREQAQTACPEGWTLPSLRLFETLKQKNNLQKLSLEPSGHYRNQQFDQEDKAMFWFAEPDKNGRPLYFDLKKNTPPPKRLVGDTMAFKPVRCVKAFDGQNHDTEKLQND